MAIDAATLKTQLFDFFQDITDQATGQVLNDVPLLGNLALPAGAAFFAVLSQEIDVALDGLAPGADANAIAAALDALDGITASEVGGSIEITIDADATVNLADVAFDLGGAIGGIGLDFDGTFTTSVAASLDVALLLDGTTGTLSMLDSTEDEVSISLNGDLDLNAAGSLGFLDITATDNGAATPEIQLAFSFDLPTGDIGGAGGAITPDVTGAVGLDLHIVTMTPVDLLPKIAADLVLDFDLTTGDSLVAFNDITIDAGSLLGPFAEIFTAIDDLLNEGPLDTILDIGLGPVPIIDDLADKFGLTGVFDVVPSLLPDGDVSLVDLIVQRDQLQGAQANQFFDALGIIDLVRDLAGDLASGEINLGSVTLTDNVADARGAFAGIAGSEALEQLDTVLKDSGLLNSIPGLADSFSANSGFKIPLLDDPSLVVEVLFNEFFGPVTIIEYDLPDLDIKGQAEIFLPLLGPLGLFLRGGVQVTADLSVGYDTTALETGNFADGMYLSTKALPGPIDTATNPTGYQAVGAANAFLEAGAGLRAVIIEASVFGGINFNVEGFFAADKLDADGRLRLADIDACFLDPLRGKATASVQVEIEIGFSPFSYTQRIPLAQTTLADFDLFDCSVASPSNPGEGLARLEPNGDLVLHTGSEAHNRIIFGVQGNDATEPEYYQIRNTPNVAGGLDVAALGVIQSFGNPDAPVTLIRGDLGQLDDTLVIDEAVTQNSVVTGGLGNDFMSGGTGRDEFAGGANNDFLIGNDGNDKLTGGDNDDVLDGGKGGDELDGGAGRDKVSYEFSNEGHGVGVYFATQVDGSLRGFGGDADGDILSNVEDIIGTRYNDVLVGNQLPAGPNGYNTLEGRDGKDVLHGARDRADYLLGGRDGDYVDGGIDSGFFDGNNPNIVDGTSYLSSLGGVWVDMTGRIFRYGDAEGDILLRIEAIQGSGFDDLIIGDASNNILDGWIGDDVLDGRGGADAVRGGLGNDTVFAGDGIDQLDGGGLINDQGRDLLTYRNAAGPVTVSLKNVVQAGGTQIFLAQRQTGPGLFETVAGYSTFENLDGSNNADFGDNLTGDLGDNIIRGLAGDDTINGDEGNDTLAGGGGADAMNGGGGIDLADYSASLSGVNVSLLTGVGSGGDAGGDTLALTGAPGSLNTIENLKGSDLSDILTGDNGVNEIDPGLSSVGNADFVDGLLGADRLTVDYSRGDLGKGMKGGFNLGSLETGGFAREEASSTTTLDAVNFTGIQQLTVIGTIRDDEIYGGSRDDVIETGNGDDIILSGLGSDFVRAGDGDDDVTYGTDINRDITYFGGNTSLFLDGGRGIDTLSVSLGQEHSDLTLIGAATGAEFNGTNASLSSGGGIVNFEILRTIITGFGDDIIVQGGFVDNTFDAGWGVDVLRPGFGDDFVSGGFDFNSSEVDIFIGDDGKLHASTEATRAGVAANPGDLLELDYSSLTGPTGVFGTVGVAISELRLEEFGASLGVYTNFGTYSGSPDPVSVFSGLFFTEIERLNVKGTNQADQLVGTYDGFGRVDGASAGFPGNHRTNLRGDDHLEGLGGDDAIVGYTGDDTLDGGEGNDILLGTDPAQTSRILQFPNENVQGNTDLMTGGAGADLFVLGLQTGYLYGGFDSIPNESSPQLADRGIVLDFTPGDGDQIVLYGSAANYHIEVIDGSSFILVDLPPIVPGSINERTIGEIRSFTGLDLTASYVQYVDEATPIIPPPPSTPLAPLSTIAGEEEGGGGPSFLSATAGGFTVNQQNESDALLAALGTSTGISNARLTIEGNADASGVFDGDPFGLGAGIVISTGKAEDVVGPNTADGSAQPDQQVELAFEFIGRTNGSDIYRADLTGLGVDINSLTLRDAGGRVGGAGGSASGFDLDALAFSTARLSFDVAGLNLNNSLVLPKLDVLDISSAATFFTAGSQRPPTTSAFPVLPSLDGAAGNLVLPTTTLDAFDGSNSLSMGDGGSIGFNLTQTLDTDGPLYLYVAEGGATGEVLRALVSVSSGFVEPDGDLSTDLGAVGPSGDTTKLTYAFTPDAGLDLVQFEFVLFSEELPEFGGSLLEDVLKIRINGVEAGALSDGASASLGSLMASPAGPLHPDLILNPPGTGPASDVTRADAYTRIITFSAPVVAGTENVLEIEVADQRDGFLDTGILIRGGSLRAAPDPEIGVNFGGAGGSADPLVEGGNDGTYLVTMPPGIDRTENVCVTLTPSDNLDLGNGPGIPKKVIFTPGGPDLIEVPVKAIDIPGEEPRPGRIDAEVKSDDPQFDGQSVPPAGFDIVKPTNVAPQITSGGEFRIKENTTDVTFVTADDINEGQTLTFSIVGGADMGRFEIDPSTGLLRFKTAPDFENPTDTGGNNVYDVVVRAADDGNPALDDDQAIKVTVTDVAETSTLFVKFVSEKAGYKNTLGWYNTGTLVGGILFQSIEADGRHPTVKEGHSTAAFTVDTADVSRIGFFLIPNGGGSAGPVKVIQLANGTWAVATVDSNGNVETDASGKPDILVGTGANALFTETSKNAGGVDYSSNKTGTSQTTSSLAGDTADGPTGKMAWEDLAATKKPNGTYTKPGDADYDDVVFLVSEVKGKTIDGNDGFDWLVGSDADDVIYGAGGHDTLYGEKGNDRIEGGDGNDRMKGGSGSDTLVFRPGFGNDKILDFDPNPSGGQDYIDLTAFEITAATFAARVTVTDLGNDLRIMIDGNPNQTILLEDVSHRSSIAPDDFGL